MSRPRLFVAAAAAGLALLVVAWPRLDSAAPTPPVHPTPIRGQAVPPAPAAAPSPAPTRPPASPAAAAPSPTPRDEARRFWAQAVAPAAAAGERWPALKQAVAWELRAQGVDPRPVRRGLKQLLGMG